jgi:starch synthase
MTDNKYNPAYDNKIPQKYSKKTIANKTKNKEVLCGELGLPYEKRIPLICITYALSDQNNLSMVQDIMNGVLEQPVQMVVTSIGTAKYQQFFTELAEKNPTQIAIAENNEEERHKIYAAADIILIPTVNNECQEESLRAMRYGAVPVTPPQDFVEDYNPNQESGNAFVYLKNSPWNLFANLIRAIETCRFPYDWKNIQASAMEVE